MQIEEEEDAFRKEKFNERVARQCYRLSCEPKAAQWLAQLEPPVEKKVEFERGKFIRRKKDEFEKILDERAKSKSNALDLSMLYV